MKIKAAAEWSSNDSGNHYVTHLSVGSNALAWVQTNGKIWFAPLGDFQQAKSVNSGPASIEGLCRIESGFATIDSEGELKLWDPSTGKVSASTNVGAPGTSLAVSTLEPTKLAIGTAAQPDASVFIYDARNLQSPLTKYVDSHNDDVTDVQWHPKNANQLLTGSTDGIINLFDTGVTDEDEAVIQAFNPGASIHRIGFWGSKRMFALSHMETLQVHSLTDDKVHDYGDVREAWNCEYVADYANSYFLAGSNSDSTLKLVPVVDKKPGTDFIDLEGGHGEEVCRAFAFNGNQLYTGGEDGKVKLWTLPAQKSTLPRKGPHKKHKHHKKKPY